MLVRLFVIKRIRISRVIVIIRNKLFFLVEFDSVVKGNFVVVL